MNEYERIAKSDNDIKGKHSNELKSKNSRRILEDYEQLSAFTEKEYSIALREKKKLERAKTYEYGDITSTIITTENDKNKIVVFEGDVNGTLNFKSVYEVEGLEYNDIDEFKETITLLEEKGYAEDFIFKVLGDYSKINKTVFKKYLREADKFISSGQWLSRYGERYLRSLAKGKRNRKGTSYSNGRTEAKFSTKLNSEGEQLSEGQAEYFKDSKVRDEDGNLLKVYHGTSEDFTVFNRTKGRHNIDIQGSFFSPWELDAQGYGENVKAYYLNITNPASEQMGYKALRMFRGQNNAGVKAREYLESLGYDGVNNGNEEYIAFNSNQIKLADNLNPTDNEDVRYSVKEQYKNNDIVNLSEDNELKILIGKKTGADKYNAIKDFVWGKLGNKVIVFSDGLRASIDKKDALHIANKSADKKTAEISAVDELIAKSKPYAYDDNVEHKKFSYFKYYESIVKFGDDIYPIYLNVGKTKNDGTYRLYDITHKIRDTAHRFNDVGRLQEFLPANSISTDKVTQNMKTVKSKDSTKLTPEEYARQIKALEKENSLLVEDNKYLKELVSIQGKLTNGKVLDSKSVDAVARNLVKKFNADGNIKELSALLQDYYSSIISSKELNWQDVLDGANKSAEWITSSVPLYHQLISRFELQILLTYRQVCFQPPKSPL